MGGIISSLVLGSSMLYISYHLLIALKDVASESFSTFYTLMLVLFAVISFSAAIFQLSGAFEIFRKGGERRGNIAGRKE